MRHIFAVFAVMVFLSSNAFAGICFTKPGTTELVKCGCNVTDNHYGQSIPYSQVYLCELVLKEVGTAGPSPTVYVYPYLPSKNGFTIRVRRTGKVTYERHFNGKVLKGKVVSE